MRLGFWICCWVVTVVMLQTRACPASPKSTDGDLSLEKTTIGDRDGRSLEKSGNVDRDGRSLEKSGNGDRDGRSLEKQVTRKRRDVHSSDGQPQADHRDVGESLYELMPYLFPLTRIFTTRPEQSEDKVGVDCPQTREGESSKEDSDEATDVNVDAQQPVMHIFIRIPVDEKRNSRKSIKYIPTRVKTDADYEGKE